MMQSVIILVLLAAAIGLVTARPELDVLRAVETIEEREINELAQIISNAEEQLGACCNHCGACDRRPSEFARCQCLDLVRQCRQRCVNCVPAKVHIYPPMYQCLDMNNMAYKDCHFKCNGATTASEVVN